MCQQRTHLRAIRTIFTPILDREYCAAPRHDVKIILGNMNAKVGRDVQTNDWAVHMMLYIEVSTPGGEECGDRASGCSKAR
jgi:hypothetical protein